jgi:hypothetical protein
MFHDREINKNVCGEWIQRAPCINTPWIGIGAGMSGLGYDHLRST